MLAREIRLPPADAEVTNSDGTVNLKGTVYAGEWRQQIKRHAWPQQQAGDEDAHCAAEQRDLRVQLQ
jgi:hypothetical protein